MTATDNTSSNAKVAGAMLAVDRASHDFRRGRPVQIRDDAGNSIIAVASEMCADQVISRLAELSGNEPSIAITHHRARTLKVRLYTDEIVLIPFKFWRTAESARTIADPTSDLANPLRGPYTANRDPVSRASIAAVQLAKIARLLPSAILVPCKGGSDKMVIEDGISSIKASDVMSYEMDTAGSLKQVTAARVPLDDVTLSEKIGHLRPGQVRDVLDRRGVVIDKRQVDDNTVSDLGQVRGKAGTLPTPVPPIERRVQRGRRLGDRQVRRVGADVLRIDRRAGQLVFDWLRLNKTTNWKRDILIETPGTRSGRHITGFPDRRS